LVAWAWPAALGAATLATACGVAVVEGLAGDVLGFVWATALAGGLLPGQLQLLTLIHDGVLQPLSEGPVD
jgi:hypothetical protein